MVKTRRRKTVKNRTMKKQIKNRQLRKRRTKKRGGSGSLMKYLRRRTSEEKAAKDMHKIIYNIAIKIRGPIHDKYESDITKIKDIPKYQEIEINDFLNFFLNKMDNRFLNNFNNSSAIFVLFIFLLFVYYTNNEYPQDFATIIINYKTDNMYVRFQKKIFKYLSNIITGKYLPNLKELASKFNNKFNKNNFKKILTEKIYETIESKHKSDEEKETRCETHSGWELGFLNLEIKYLNRLFKIMDDENKEYIFPEINMSEIMKSEIIKEKSKENISSKEKISSNYYELPVTVTIEEKKKLQMKLYDSFIDKIFTILHIDE